MTSAFESPGFVDHHVHLLGVSAGVPAPWGEEHTPEAIAAYHRAVAARGSTPMDETRGEPRATDLETALLDGLRTAASLGLVAVTEAGLPHRSILDALLRLRERAPLPVRVRVLVASGLAEREMPARTGDDLVEVIGVKFYADGWLGPHTCALHHPFEDRPGDDAGLLFLDADTLARRAAPFAEDGWTIATHAIGDRAVAAVLDAYERVYGEDCRRAAPRIEHAQVLSPDLVARMADLGVVACVQPGFAQTDAEVAVAALGEERARHAYDWRGLLDAGVRVVLGSDFPIEPLDPLDGLRRLAEGAPVSAPIAPAEALPLMTDAAAGVTLLSADPADADPAALTVLGTRL